MHKICDVTDFLALYQNPATEHRLVRATNPLKAGAVLHSFSARAYLATPSYLSLQVGIDQHILLAPEFLQYINHSCEPNVHFDMDLGQVIGLRDIEATEEITFFYPSTEWTMAQPFQCLCGSAGCLGTIRGAAHLNRTVLNRYHLARHIHAQLEACSSVVPA